VVRTFGPGKPVPKRLSELNIIFQSYVSVSPASPRFHTEKGILRLDPRVPIHARQLARRRSIVVEFRDFSNYLLNRDVEFLVNGAVLEALNSPAENRTSA
jgi:hypothetical protein